jgi:electron transfer flavoprotein alpha/beta subunit
VRSCQHNTVTEEQHDTVAVRLTLSVHKVGYGNGVTALSLGDLGVEHDVRAALRAGAEVLLAELVNLSLDGGALL